MKLFAGAALIALAALTAAADETTYPVTVQIDGVS
jgi:uncharacterized protein (DUF2141 family)